MQAWYVTLHWFPVYVDLDSCLWSCCACLPACMVWNPCICSRLAYPVTLPVRANARDVISIYLPRSRGLHLMNGEGERGGGAKDESSTPWRRDGRGVMSTRALARSGGRPRPWCC